MKNNLSRVSLLTLTASVSVFAQSAGTTSTPTQMLAPANANPDQPAATGGSSGSNAGKGSKNFWANWLERKTAPATAASKKSSAPVYAKAFTDAAGADAAPEPAPGPEPIGPAVNKETDAAKEIQILKDRLDKLQKVIDEQSQGGGNAAPAASAPPLKIPEPLSAPDPAPANDKDTPFAYGDQSWFNGSPRNSPVLDTKFFTGEVRFDTHFMEDFNQPIDHTMGGATESFRSGEFQVEQISFGGDFHYDNVRGRVLTMFGLFASTTPRNDGSAGVGQWDVRSAYKYVSEAWGGYHFNVAHGLNVDAGIFVSYIGLFSYYNYDNWTYQPSYVSANTPWFFQGIRLQFFPSDKLKIEPWIINGWQSYGMFNSRPGLGGQILWRPNGSVSVVLNNYTGKDVLGNPDRKRFHTDDSLTVKYYDNPNKSLTKAAFSFTADFGCEYGGGVKCTGGNATKPSQYFAGWMLYNRLWFGHDKYAFVVGGGQMTNPGRYLAILPPVNGATSATGTPYFTENPGDSLKAWDVSTTFQYVPRDEITFLAEWGYRHANVPYFAGPGGVTPPGGNNGNPTQVIPGWAPDLVKSESRVNFALMVKF